MFAADPEDTIAADPEDIVADHTTADTAAAHLKGRAEHVVLEGTAPQLCTAAGHTAAGRNAADRVGIHTAHPQHNTVDLVSTPQHSTAGCQMMNTACPDSSVPGPD